MIRGHMVQSQYKSPIEVHVDIKLWLCYYLFFVVDFRPLTVTLASFPLAFPLLPPRRPWREALRHPSHLG